MDRDKAGEEGTALPRAVQYRESYAGRHGPIFIPSFLKRICMIAAYIFVGVYFLVAQWLIRRWLTELFLFRSDEYNPYRRYCKKCGQWQSMYDNGGQRHSYHSWWEEIYPIGNNPTCKCKKYARNN